MAAHMNDRSIDMIEVSGKKVQKLNRHKMNPEYFSDRRQVFIIGSKGIPAAYGGFETFVEKLTEYRVSDSIRYHVSRIAEDDLRYLYNDAKCFNVKVRNIGAAKAVYYDVLSLRRCIDYCKERPSIKNPVFYVLACRIGPFIGHFKKEIERLGGKLYVNPDGHEWKRSKWSLPVRKYWKLSEAKMVKYADLLICDSKNIESYIREEYRKYHPQTTFIAYGSDTKASSLADDAPLYSEWLTKNGLSSGNYYLVVGRFVPENSFEDMIREFMRSESTKNLAIVTTKNDLLLNELENKLHFQADPRIKFVGTVYDQELLKKIRENAYAYLHGHTVGGTNPSLLEALGSTKLNLLIDVGFNREVAEDAALYWSNRTGDLAALINEADKLSTEKVSEFEKSAKRRIAEYYNWERIVSQYEELFLKEPAD